MNSKAASLINILTLIAVVIALYGGLAYFLISTDKINRYSLEFNIKFMYFLIALLFGAVVILYTLILNKIRKKTK